MNFRKTSKYVPFITILLFLLYVSLSDHGFFVYFNAFLLSLLVYGLGQVIELLCDILDCLRDNPPKETDEIN